MDGLQAMGIGNIDDTIRSRYRTTNSDVIFDVAR